jgi:predicted permease
MWPEMRSALRNLRAAPLYAAAATLTLALAIAACTAIFAVVYAVLLRPLPLAEPHRLVIAWETDPARGQTVMELTYRQFEGWRSGAGTFERMAAISSSAWPVVLEGRGDPVRLMSTGVSSSFFDTVGAQPALGRLFTAGDDEEKEGRVVVLSHKLWSERLGADPHIIGRSLALGGQPHTVVGVMPRDFDVPRGTELWLPVLPVLRQSSAEWGTDVPANVGLLHVVGRLRDGVTLESARTDLNVVAVRHAYFPGQAKTVVATPLLDHLLGPLREGLWWLLAAVGVLLIVACANVSSLTLTRAAVRRREHGIRLALGATRLQLGRLWMAEAALIGAAGGMLGVVAAKWLLAAIVALAPDDVPRLADVGIDLPVAAFTLMLTIVAASLCAAAAVANASSVRTAEILVDGGRATASRTTSRVRSALVIAQIALAIVVLVSAGLVARSFSALRRLDVGFDPRNVLTLAVKPGSAEMPARDWFTRTLERIEGLPGVESAGAVFLRPLAFGAIGTDTSFLYEGQGGSFEKAVADGARNPKLNVQMATPGYFRAMRIPLLRGRLFDERDTASSPRVVVIGETAAARLWPGQDPIGKRLNTPQNARGKFSDAWHTVIGVVKDVHYRGVNDVRLDLYEPAAQSLKGPEFLVVRTSGDPLALAGAVGAQIREHDPRAVVSRLTTMEAILARELAPWRLSSWLLALFAAMTFALAVVGLVGVVGLEVTERLRDLAVRMALGADARRVQAHVLGSALRRAAAGLVLGLGCALAATQWMRALLFGVSPVDLPTYALVSCAVALTVLVASLAPATRASRVDPIQILKRE